MVRESGRGLLPRILMALGLVLGVITLSFLLIHLAPGDPVTALVGEYGGASPEFITDLRRRFGLDRPLIVQFVLYVSNVLRGDLGESWRFQLSVTQVIIERLPATVLLLGTSIGVFTLLGVVAGVYSATHADSTGDNIIRGLVVLGYAIPVFWFAQLLIYVFAVRLAVFPVMGIQSFSVAPGVFPKVLDTLWHLALPATALGVWNLAVTQRFMSANMVQVLREDYIRAAFARGLTRWQVVYRHALRNALLPVVTMTGLSFSTMMTGAVLTETVFSWPGLGRLMFEAIGARDRSVLLGLLLVGSIMAILVDLITDVVYGLLDPRMRGEE